MQYLYETHCHCSQCSHCASSTSQELALAYYKAGYAGMILTDHFISGNTALDRSLPWDIQVKAYYQAYLDACEAVADLDFDVLFGIEHAYGDGKEVLVYGIDLDFLLANPDLCDISLDEFVDRVHTAGGLVVQAHPYRDRSYINMSVELITPIAMEEGLRFAIREGGQPPRRRRKSSVPQPGKGFHPHQRRRCS
mgnify:CR=1 FL=1